MPPVASAASAPRVAARPSALRRDHPRSRTTATTKPRASSAEEGVRASPSVSQIPDFASATVVVWDVDGTGLREIEDKTIAKRIRDKVNDFNAKSAVAVALATAAYCAIPVG